MSAELFYDRDPASLSLPIVILEGDERYPKLFAMAGEIFAAEIIDPGNGGKCRKCSFNNDGRCGHAPRCNKGTGVMTYIRGDRHGFNDKGVFHGKTEHEFYFVPSELPFPIEKVQVEGVEL